MRIDLPNGLILCSMTDEFREALPTFTADVFIGDYGPNDKILGTWTQDLLSTHHPTVTDDDVWMVIDADNRIVSTLLLIPQVWSYENVTFGVGRVELVATHPEYRNMGLIRQLMEVAHQRSAALGHTIQVITGIPNYYRQFGYTMAIKLGPEALLPFFAVAKLKDDEAPKYSLRPATPADIPALMGWYDNYRKTLLLSVERTEKKWAHEITTRPMGIPPSVRYFIIEKEQQGVGYVGIRDLVESSDLEILEYVIGEQASYLDTFDDVMRAAKKFGEAKDTHPACLSFDSGIHATVHTLIRKSFGGVANRPTYAWFVRAASPAQLIETIAPVLEKRLAGSGAHCYTGEIKIAFHDRTGLLMKFDQGKLNEASNIKQNAHGADAAFPWHLFLNLVLGHQTIEEIRTILPDTYASSKNVYALLEILFPVKKSWVMGQM
ncbi:MAG: GNAT family N-acetyltransferase [Anaerolineae bacterium]|nr:GNAT family N-acetyltransferase [Anaerolineae bacterium]